MRSSRSSNRRCYRASGLGRPGLIIQLTAPLLATRLALGSRFRSPIALWNQLLGFDRPFRSDEAADHAVEWGIMIVPRIRRCLMRSIRRGARNRIGRAADMRVGPADLTLDRVGPDAFNPADLGSIVAIRWAVSVGDVSGAVGLWVPESVVQLWIASAECRASELEPADAPLKTTWPRDSAGTVPGVS